MGTLLQGRRVFWVLMLLGLCTSGCQCNDTAALIEFCAEAESCAAHRECTQGKASRTDDIESTERSFCRPAGASTCELGERHAVGPEGKCWIVDSGCLPEGFRPAEPGECDAEDVGRELDDGTSTSEEEEEPKWYNNGPEGRLCPDGCSGGKTCLAGECVEPCKADRICDEGIEICKRGEEGEPDQCVEAVNCSRSGNAHDPVERNCEIDWRECGEENLEYRLHCQALGEEGPLECKCIFDEKVEAVFEWHETICFCDYDTIANRMCGWNLEELSHNSCSALETGNF